MKKFIIIIFTILIGLSSLSAKIKLSDNSLSANICFVAIDTWGNQVAVLGRDNIKNNNGTVDLFDGHNWFKLPGVLKSGSGEKPILINEKSKIKFDNNGDIWVSGNSIYKYSAGSWMEFSLDDSLAAYRKYGHFCIDSKNNLWIESNVHNNESNISSSEILKLENSKFRVITRNDSNRVFGLTSGVSKHNTIALLKDGRIGAYAYPIKSNNSTINDDFYIFNEDYSWTTIGLKPENDIPGKALSNVYCEPDGNIWFSYDVNSFTSKNSGSTIYCCSGLSMFDGTDWTFITTENGLPKEFGLYPAVWGIIKLDDYYLVLTRFRLYRMDLNYQLNNLDWGPILDNAEFIRCAEWVDEEYVDQYLANLIHPEKMQNLTEPVVGQILRTVDGTIWLLVDHGIIKIDPLKISGIDEYPTERVSIFPTPVRDFIHLSGIDTYKEADIKVYSITGELLLCMQAQERIDVSSLAPGLYYLKIGTKNLTFIKVK